jgi:geranylgeranyl pyrophosphate synthase
MATMVKPEAVLQQTFTFLETHILPATDWPALTAAVMFRRQQARPATAVFTDSLPAVVYQALGGELAAAVPLNACWLLHLLAARIFDDIQDGEGEENPWQQAGTAQAIPIGVALLGAAGASLAHLTTGVEVMADLLHLFGRTTAAAARAQAAESQGSLADTSLDHYFAHIIGTTAEVFAAGAWAGGRLWGGNTAEMQALYDFGYNLGMRLAILDDCLDIAELSNGRYRLPVLYAVSRQDHPEGRLLTALLMQPQLTPAQSQQAQALLTEMGAISWSVELAATYQEKALAALAVLAVPAREALIPYA